MNNKDGRGRKRDEEQTAFIDSTVQEKNVTFPTDSKLLNKVIEYCRKVAKAEGIKVRQSYTCEINELKLTQRFRGKSHSKKKVAKADRRMHGRKIRMVRQAHHKILAGDRGYRGQQMSGDTKILIPDVPKAADSAYAKSNKHKLFRKRAGIEPSIGHCKSDHRLGRNFYKGLFGDSINVMLAAAGFNFKVCSINSKMI